MPFATALKRLREAAGLTQAGLAEQAGLSLRTIQGWEQGRRSPVSPDFFQLARALGVTCESFADCEDVADVQAPPAKKAPKKKGK